MHRNDRNSYRCLLLAVVATCGVLQSCRTPSGGSADAILQSLPCQERFAASDYFHADVPTLTSINYGPEWRTLYITRRTLANGTLTATRHRWKGSAFHAATTEFESSVLYTTSDSRTIRIFHDFRHQLAHPSQRIADDSRIVTSNPFWVAHVAPDTGHGIMLPYPWSNRDSEWIAAAAAIMRASIDPENAASLWARPGVSLSIGRMLISAPDSHEPKVDSWPGWYLHVALSFFDLEQEYFQLLRSGAPIVEPVYEDTFGEDEDWLDGSDE